MTRRFTGGCLCGALRYEAVREPRIMGHCYCADCRKASGSGFIPFMGFAATDLTFHGTPIQCRSPGRNGGVATRNRCATCFSLVFGGEIGLSDSFTIYAGSLDDPALFQPRIAIFTAGRPDWAIIPPGLTQFEAMPP